MVVDLENNLLLCRAPKGIISQNVYLLKKCQPVGEQLEAKACYDSFPAQLLSGWCMAGACSHSVYHKEHVGQLECLGEECSSLLLPKGVTVSSDYVYAS